MFDPTWLISVGFNLNGQYFIIGKSTHLSINTITGNMIYWDGQNKSTGYSYMPKKKVKTDLLTLLLGLELITDAQFNEFNEDN